MNKMNSVIAVILCLFSFKSSLAGPIHDFIIKNDVAGLADYISERKPDYTQFMRANRNGATPLLLAKKYRNRKMIRLVKEVIKFLASEETSIFVTSPVREFVIQNNPLGLSFYLTYHPMGYYEFTAPDRNGITVIDLALRTKDVLMIGLVRETAGYLLDAEHATYGNPVRIQAVLDVSPEKPVPQSTPKVDAPKAPLFDLVNTSAPNFAEQAFRFDDQEELDKGFAFGWEN